VATKKTKSKAVTKKKKAVAKKAAKKTVGAYAKIVARLSSEEVNERLAAIAELRAFKNVAAVEGLMEGLRDASEEVVREALEGISELGEASIPPLIAALRHKSWSVRRNSAKALVRLGQASLDAIVEAMYSDDEDVQFWASEVLTEFGEEGLDRFLEILEKGSQANRSCAIAAIGKIGSARAVPALVEQLGDESWAIRRAASDALWEIGSSAVPSLKKALDHKSSDVQFWAIQALGEIADPSAVPALVKKVKKATGEEERINIIKALGEIADPKAAATLIGELGHESWFVRRAAGEALWTVGPSAVDKLIKALKHKNVNVRYWGCKVLGEMQAAEAVAPIVKLLGDKEWSIRSGAAYALGEIGDESAGEALLDHLEDPNEIVRKNVVIALGQIGDAKAIRSSSEAALEDQSEWVRRYTAENLEKIKDKKIKSSSPEAACEGCGFTVETVWKFCPGCGNELGEA
jgi:HEAT repeat protein